LGLACQFSLLLLAVECVFSQLGVELHELKAVRSVALVLCRRVVAFSILGTNEADNFSNFAFFLSHLKTSTRCRAPGRTYIMFNLHNDLQRHPAMLVRTRGQGWKKLSSI
jgi:hypothetical protein